MATCPECKATISDNATNCEYCGKRVIAGDTLSSVPKRITLWQKIVIVVSIFILIAIGFTFKDAEQRENRAAQQMFNHPAEQIVAQAANVMGLSSAYGSPQVTSRFEPKKGIIFVDFTKGPMSVNQAADFGLKVCRTLARTYVEKGYMPRALAVSVGSTGINGTHIHYGTAVFNGNVDIIGWEPANVN